MATKFVEEKEILTVDTIAPTEYITNVQPVRNQNKAAKF